MLRVISNANDPATRIENRVGEPAANPYLYLASQIFSGLDGLNNNLKPIVPVDAPYDTDADPLPVSLEEALVCIENSDYFRNKMGSQFIDYLLKIKKAKAIETTESAITKRFAVGLPGTKPPAKNVKPA